jgi:hypothetical protein
VKRQKVKRQKVKRKNKFIKIDINII